MFFSFKTLRACVALFDKFIFCRTLPETKLLNWVMFLFNLIAPVVTTFRYSFILNTLTIRTFPTILLHKSILIEPTFFAKFTKTTTAITTIAVP